MRLQLYKSIKDELKMEEYLQIPKFEARRLITKIRCSGHRLEVEKGRHLNIPREERICKICTAGEIENEHHFLVKCKTYDQLKTKYKIHNIDIHNLLKNVDPDLFGNYLIESFRERERK